MRFIRHTALAVLFVVSLSAQASTTIETPNGTFPLIDQGTGPAVLLLHGFPDSKDVWKHQIPALTEAGFRVIAPDLRGYGDAPSPMAKEAYAIPVLMSDVIGMLDALGLDKVYLVGHDWGAGLSWQLASFFQHRFNSMIVLSVGPPDVPAWSSIEQRRMSWYFYLFLQEGLAEKTLADYDWRLMRQFLESHPEAEQVIERLKQGNQMTTALNWYRGNLQDRLAQPGADYVVDEGEPPVPEVRIHIPVLGVWSDLDIYLSEAQVKQSSMVAADFTFRKIEGAGHWMMLDKPDEVNALLLDFLAEHSSE